ncbi:MAG: sulfatase-like hydrolase/transferase [Candidatus Solibacter usitatus]|nr:sulfatase-like hydrolase/transferase [Candidatus Solibacter usitatus]
MTRRELLSTSAGAALAAPAGRKPNIIVMLADDLGYEDLGCTGSDYIRTPHIDGLAQGGTRFTHWYANAPVCAPSRGALMTGRYPQRNGVDSNGKALAVSEPTMAEVLRPAGYRTALLGKWHLGSTPETVPNARGFDRFFGFHNGCVDFFSHRYYWGEPGRVNFHDLWRDRMEVFEDGRYLTDMLGAEAERFIAADTSKPFFLYQAFNAPHYPMHAPPEKMRQFAGLPLERQVRAAMISSLDDAVGRIVQTLKRRGELDNTLIFFSSDNGATREPRGGLNQKPPEAGFNRPWRGYKFSLFDGGMHVPAILHWPGRVPAGKVNSGLAAHMDVLPTACAAAGIAAPGDRILDGRDVLPMAGGGASPHQELFWESGKQGGVRAGNWKLVLNGSDFDYSGARGYVAPAGEDAVFLSDLENDPGERRNLSGWLPERAAGMKQAWEQWRAAVAQR